MPTIWIIDDDRAVCASIALLLKRANFEFRTFYHPKTLLETLPQQRPDLILLDMNFTIDTSGRAGLSTLKSIKEQYADMPVILMTGWATVQLAVEGMKMGAKDFVAKPWDNKQLLQSIKTILTLSVPKKDTTEISDFDHIIGRSESLQKVLQVAKNISKTNASVLIMGESGTGKELVAEAIHYDSLRQSNPFVKVNLGGISSSLFESELFGHKRGAFTDAISDRIGRFEKADTGTIFLDEIGELPLNNQVKLLRVLQEQTFEVLGSSETKRIDVRVITATNKNLPDLVKNGQFREDLFYRINLITLHIPPLRERKKDIPLLAQHFAKNLAIIYQKEGLILNPKALEWLSRQVFPGNIRELKNLVERTILVCGKDVIDAVDFQEQIATNFDQVASTNLPKVGEVSLEELEKQMIQKALNYHNFQISETARSLGITRNTLYRRMSKYQISDGT